ncbi:acyltransferase family protein [Streptomyces sp. NPDC058662]|uniref:acyltransferase family protein n=1 Tax=Streptomyces sp. NPDC058662 TaxID=3346583 RepID=UPI0036642FF5
MAGTAEAAEAAPSGTAVVGAGMSVAGIAKSGVTGGGSAEGAVATGGGSAVGAVATGGGSAVAAAAGGGIRPGGRLAGVDAVRGLAVLGMFAVHVGPGAEPAGAGYLLVAADGRAPALFTLLAGFSLVLSQRGRNPSDAPGGWAARYRPLLIRCAILAALGLGLASLWPGILVILAFFAVYFLAAEPFTRLSTPVLTAVAGVSVAAGPLLSFVLGPVFGYGSSGRGMVPEASDLTSWAGLGDVVTALLLTGAYPLATYFPYVLAGMALARLCDIRERAVSARLAGWGAAAAAAGYGSAWLATHVLGSRERLLEAISVHHPEALGAADPVREVLNGQYGAVPSTSWDWLLVADPYSQTPLETLGNAGVGAALIGLCALVARHRLGAGLLRPLTLLGAMALSAYVVHALVLAGPAHGAASWGAWIAFSGGALGLTWVWQRACADSPLRRGPVEYALRLAAQGRA